MFLCTVDFSFSPFFPLPHLAGSSHKSDKAVACPLCQDTFDGQDQLENHAMNTHSVNAEGLHKLQTLMNGANLFNNKNRDASPPPEKGKHLLLFF